MKLREKISAIGLPRLIIAAFLVVLIITGPMVGVALDSSMDNLFNRIGMFSILVLSLIPMIQSGCGLNFGLPIGVVSGILGGVISIELNIQGYAGIFVAIAIGIVIGLVFGALYGWLLNRIRGDEMLIATYVGYSFVALISIFDVVAPFQNPVSVMSYGGQGLRQQIPVANYWMKEVVAQDGTRKSVGLISDFLSIPINDQLSIPVGMFLLFAVMAFFIWLFFRTKTGTAMTAVGSNPDFAQAAGVNINRMRLISVMLSTAIAAVGIIVYQQSYGFIQLYTAPLTFTFQTVAAILIGGASLHKANILHAIIGTILFQGILTMTPVVINGALSIDVSEVIRIIVTNGMIIYALTRRNRS